MQYFDLLLQHPHGTLETYALQHVLATSEEGREREVQPEKTAPGLATPDLMMSRAEVEHHGDAS
jgi:hypothetical protein